jgi:hypothetical protein
MWGALTILEDQRRPSVLLFNYWSLRRQLVVPSRKVVLAVSTAAAFIACASSGRMNPSATPRSSAVCHRPRYASRSG